MLSAKETENPNNVNIKLASCIRQRSRFIAYASNEKTKMALKESLSSFQGQTFRQVQSHRYVIATVGFI